jgi:cytochrome P450
VAGLTGIAADTGAVVVLRYDDIERLSHDPRLAGIGLSVFDFLGIGDGPLRSWYSSLMFTNEGDAHHRLRRLAARVFTPRSVERHRELAGALADARMAKLVADGGGDLVAALVDVPITVICTLIGVPDDQIADFIQYGDALSPVFGLMDAEQVAVAERAVVDLMRDVEAMIDSRLDERGDDLISGLLDAEEAGDRLAHDEVVTMVGNLIVGGHDTTSGQVSCSLLTLLRHPDAASPLVDQFQLPPIFHDRRPSPFGIPLLITDPNLRRQPLLRYLNDHGVATRLVFGGNLTKQPYLCHRSADYRIAMALTNTDLVMAQAFWVGCWPGLGPAEMDYILETLTAYCQENR